MDKDKVGILSVDEFFEHLGDALAFVFIVLGVFLVFLAVGWGSAFVLRVLLDDLLGCKRHYVRLASAIVKTFFILFGIYAAFYFVSVEIVSILTGVGIFSIIIGFALQDPIANFVSGIIIEASDIVHDRHYLRIAYYGSIAKGRVVAHRTFHIEICDKDNRETYFVPNAILLRFMISERRDMLFVEDQKALDSNKTAEKHRSDLAHGGHHPRLRTEQT